MHVIYCHTSRLSTITLKCTNIEIEKSDLVRLNMWQLLLIEMCWEELG